MAEDTLVQQISLQDDTRSLDSDGLVSDDELRAGAEKLELFLLRPARYAGNRATVRLRFNGKLSGWKLKDGLLDALGLPVGDTINVETTLLMGPGYFSDTDDVDLFASGDEADQLIEAIRQAGRVEGCTIDCEVVFSFCDAPVGRDDRMVTKASTILQRVIRFVEVTPVATRIGAGSQMDNPSFRSIFESIS